MRRSLLVSPLALVLVVLAAVPAAAGGWATVGLDSTPAGVGPGQALEREHHGAAARAHAAQRHHAHGGRSPPGPSRASSPATPTKKPGVYRASVVFPSAGRWSYKVDDGFMGQPTPTRR